MFNKHDISRDACQLFGAQARCGYDWWWHSFTGRHAVTGEEKAFFIEFFLCNPASGGPEPVFGQLPENRKRKLRELCSQAGGEYAAAVMEFVTTDHGAVEVSLRHHISRETLDRAVRRYYEMFPKNF